MNYDKDFSIIIPHYNSAELLDKLLLSIGKHDKLQIIVVDDHSDAPETAKLDRLKEEFDYVEFYQNNQDKNSAGICRNTGLEHAEGKWVLFADADDYFIEGFFDILLEYRECTADMIIFPAESVFRETGEVADRHLLCNRYIEEYHSKPTATSELVLRYKIPTVWSKLIRLDIILENHIRFDETYVANDVCFAMKSGYYCKSLIVSDKTIYCCTKAKNTLTTAVSMEKNDIRMRVFCDYYHFLEEKLSKKEFKKLKLNGGNLIISAKLDGFNLQYILKLAFWLKKNKIPLLDRRIFNVPYVISKLYEIKRQRDTYKLV